MNKKIIFTSLLTACLASTSAYAAFEPTNVDITKNVGSEYTVAASGAESSAGVMLVVYGDVKNNIDETISLDPTGEIKDYYIYYTRYFAKENASMDISANVDLPDEVLAGNVYASLISYDGTVKHLSDVAMPGIKSVKSIKLLLPDGTEAKESFTVTAGDAYVFSVLVEDGFGNKFKSTDLTFTLSGINSSSVAINKSALIIDKKSDVYGKKFNFNVSMGDLSDTVEIIVEEGEEDYSGGGTSGGGGGGKTSGGGGGVTVAPSVVAGNNVIFEDLSQSHWAFDSIMNLYNKGIVQGSGKTVNPSGLITREEICALIARSCGLKADEATAEKISADTTVSSWAVDYVSAAVANGVVTGDNNGVINGLANATRQEAFVILARAFGIAESANDASYADMSGVADWAKGYINALNEKNLVNGTEGYIHPVNNITRAEFFAVLDRILN